MKAKSTVAAICLLILLTTCIHSSAAAFKFSDVWKIEIGMTKAQVLGILGRPTEIVKRAPGAGGDEGWLWEDKGFFRKKFVSIVFSGDQVSQVPPRGKVISEREWEQQGAVAQAAAKRAEETKREQFVQEHPQLDSKTASEVLSGKITPENADLQLRLKAREEELNGHERKLQEERAAIAHAKEEVERLRTNHLETAPSHKQSEVATDQSELQLIQKAADSNPTIDTNRALESLVNGSPKGFRFLAWGDAPHDLKKYSGPTRDGLTMYIPAADNKPSALFGITVAEECYLFTSDRFCSASAFIDGMNNFEAIEAQLRKRFGKPVFSNHKIHLFKWKWPNGVGVTLYFQDRSSRSTVTFSNDSI